jgi:GTPase SAR1 family protein
VFIGPSGAGKTTIAGRLPGWTVLADDTTLVWCEHGLWRVSGTPLRGREGHPTCASSALLAAIIVLVPHRSPPRLVALPAADALHASLARVFHHPSPAVPSDLRDRLFANLVALTTAVPTFALENDLGAAVEPLLSAPGGPDV